MVTIIFFLKVNSMTIIEWSFFTSLLTVSQIFSFFVFFKFCYRTSSYITTWPLKLNKKVLVLHIFNCYNFGRLIYSKTRSLSSRCFIISTALTTGLIKLKLHTLIDYFLWVVSIVQEFLNTWCYTVIDHVNTIRIFTFFVCSFPVKTILIIRISATYFTFII